MKPTLARVCSATFAVACATGALLAAQGSVVRPQPDMRQVGTSAVSGVVVDADTGRPIPGVVVHLGRSPRGPIGFQNRQISDSRGRFVFVDQPAGEGFVLTGGKPGYFQPPTPPQVGGTPGDITLAEGQWLRDVRLALRRTGAIEGRVTDEAGEPVVGIDVRAVALVDIAGRRQLASGPITRTDDRGRYRVAGLLPGTYLVMVPSLQASVTTYATVASIHGYSEAQFASQAPARARSMTVPILDADDGLRVVIGRGPVPPPPVDGQRFGYAATFHPGTPHPDQATRIELSGADAVADIQLQPVPTGSLRGRVEGPGQMANLFVRLVTHPDLGLGLETATARTHVDGTFAFANVPAGEYVLDVPATLTEYQFRPAGPLGDGPERPQGTGSFNSRIWAVRGAPEGTTVVSYSSGSASFAGGTAMSSTDNSEGLYAREPVSVLAGASPDVVVRLRGTLTIRGHVVFEGDAAGTGAANIGADPATGSPGLGLSSAFANTRQNPSPFELRDIVPGVYFLRQVFPSQWTIKSIVHEGRDYFEQPIDLSGGQSIGGVVITATRETTTIAGSVVRPNGDASTTLHAVAFPTDRSAWTDFGLQPPRMISVPVSTTGTFRFTGIPAGDYYVATIPGDDEHTWRRDSVLARLSSTAERTTVAWGQTATVVIRSGR